MKYPIKLDLDFRRNPYKGLYIAFEGIDGSGKTTQVRFLQEYFEKQGKKVVVTNEPTNNLIIGKFIREKILLAKVNIPSEAYQFLFSADRVVNHSKIVEPALKQGKVVISHRTFWSALVYGVIDKGETIFSEENINTLLIAQGILSHYHQFLVADKTFYLDLSIETALKRLSQRNNGFGRDIYERKDKMEAVLKGYRWLVKKFPKEIIVLDAEKSVNDVTKEILKHL